MDAKINYKPINTAGFNKIIFFTGLLLSVKVFNDFFFGNDLFLFSFFVSLFFVYLFMRYRFFNTGFEDSLSKRHGIHKTAIPRIGGFAIFLTVFLIGTIFFNKDLNILFFLAASTIVFLIGLFEDYTQELPPFIRLIMMAIPVTYILIVLNGIIYDLYYIKLYFPVALIFTIISIIGFINAVNIIDGLNGLSSGIAIIGFLFIAFATENPEIKVLSGIFLFSTLGFFLVNIYTGKVFLGDGGSYLLGFALGEVSVIVANEPSLSPWFPFSLLIYPVWEVLFSMYRRKKQGKSVFHADKLHLHTLLYNRYFKKMIKDPVKANSAASLTILVVVLMFSGIVFVIKDNIYLLTIYCLFFAVFYTVVYRSIIHFKLGKIIKKDKKTALEPLGEIK